MSGSNNPGVGVPCAETNFARPLKTSRRHLVGIGSP